MKSIITTSAVLLFVLLAGSRCAPGRLGTVDQYLLGPTESDGDRSYDSTAAPTTAESESEDDHKTTGDYALDYGDSSEIPLVLHVHAVQIESFTEVVDDSTEDQYV